MNEVEPINARLGRESGRGIYGANPLKNVAYPAIGQATRAFIGRGKMYSQSEASELTDIPVKEIQKYRSGEATPSLDKLLRLCAEMPPEFTDIILFHAGLGGVRRLSDGEACGLELNAEAAQIVAMIAMCLADDGIIDHRETQSIVPSVRRLRSICDDFLNKAGKAAA